MLFNKNIVLEILRSNFAEEIDTCVGKCVASLDDLELGSTFESRVDFAVFDVIEEMEVDDYTVEKEDDEIYVEGTFDVLVSADGYQCINGENVYKDSGNVHFGIGFSFYIENDKYSDIELEYLY